VYWLSFYHKRKSEQLKVFNNLKYVKVYCFGFKKGGIRVFPDPGEQKIADPSGSGTGTRLVDLYISIKKVYR